MKSIVILFLLFSLIMSCNAKEEKQAESHMEFFDKNEQELLIAVNKFGFKFFQHTNELEKNKNIFVSPLSLSIALGMLLNGANSNTFDSIQKALDLPELEKDKINTAYKMIIESILAEHPKIKTLVNNAIFHRHNYIFQKDFIEVCKEYFNTTVEPLDFSKKEAIEIINNWVHNSTKGKIEKVVNSIDERTVMFLLNVIYFKGIWKNQFDPEKTLEDYFFSSEEEKQKCMMMYIKSNFGYMETEKFQAIELPYDGDKFAMILFLPKNGQKLEHLLSEFTFENFNQWIKEFQTHEVNFYIPRFKFEYDINLRNILTNFGMGIAFDPGKADFSKLYKGPEKAFVSAAKQKAFIEVNEEGTEAVAVTSIEVGVTSIRQELVMRCDRPFVFLIRDKESNSNLFFGKLYKP